MHIAAHPQKHETGVLAMLIAEHRRISDLFDGLERLTEPEARARRFDLLVRELLSHTRAEQAIVYERLAHSRELEREIEDAQHHHARIEEMVATIRTLAPDDEPWQRRIEELRRMVELHVEEEEREVIPRAHLVVDDRALDDMMVSYRYEKAYELARMEGRTSDGSST